jgi:TMEM175 potassium channel family protein
VPYGVPVAEREELARPDTDEEPEAGDNSLGRLLTLSDGIFAIAMTLLALDLKVPDLGEHPGDAALRHALAANADSYWSYLLTFYVIATYWTRHRRLMRSVVTIHPVLIRDTLLLLFLVAAMPFPANLLGRYGGEATALALYGGVSALSTLVLIVMSRDVERLQLAPGAAAVEYGRRWSSWWSLLTFVLCVPAGYIAGSHGPYVLVLLTVPGCVSGVRRLLRLRK